MTKVWKKWGVAVLLVLCAALCALGLVRGFAAGERAGETGEISLDDSGLFVTDARSGAQRGYRLPDELGGGTGLLITGESYGATLTYTQVVDVEKVRGDMVAFEAPLTDRYGTAGFELTMVDFYDPDNRLSVIWSESDDAAWAARVTVSYGGKTLGRNNLTGQHAEDSLGTLITTNNFSGLYDQEAQYAHKPFSFRFDAETGEIFVDPYDLGGEYLVLNAAESLGFPGFSTGEVLIELRFLKLKNEGGIVLTELAGRSLAGAVQAESSNCIRIDTDADYYEDNLPGGYREMAYPVPQVIPGDGIRSDFPVEISLKKEGADASGLLNAERTAFTPDTTGSYEICYSAEDINGLPTQKVYHVEIAEETAYVPVDLVVDDAAADWTYGGFCKLPTVSVKEGTGAGNVALEYSYLYNGEPVEPDALGEIRLTEAGSLELHVRAQDYLLQQVTDTYTYEIARVGGIVFAESIPDALAAGSAYQLPAFTATDATGRELTPRILVNGEAATGSITPEGAEVVLRFEGMSGNEVAVYEEMTIPVLSVDSGEPSDWFLTDGVTKTDSENGVIIESADGSGSVRLPKPVSVQDLFIDLIGVRDKTSYEYIEFRATDALDDQITLAFRFYPLASGTLLCARGADGEFSQEYTSSAILDQGYTLSLMLDGKTGNIWDSSLLNVLLTGVYTEQGHLFTGFPSREVRVEFGFGGGSAGDAFVIRQVSNQMFAKVRNWSDNVGPMIYLDGDISSENYPKGSQVDIPAAYATDVLQTKSSVVLTVTAPSGNVIHQDNTKGYTDAWTLALDEYGTYRVEYRSTDAVGRTYTTAFDIQSVDVTKPEITVDGTYEARYEIGASVKLHDFRATDDLTTDLKTYIMIRTPGLDWEICQAGEDYRFMTDGSYLIVYYARDAAYNVARVEFTVSVEGK